jgi:Fur family transcriptional regulator, ferric uptake regulator
MIRYFAFMLPALAPLPTAASVETVRLKELLRQAGLKATEARLLVLAQLVLAEQPMSHPELTLKLQELSLAKPKPLDKHLDRATIYRNLMDLVEKGLVERVHYGDRVWRFRFHAHPTSASSVLPEHGFAPVDVAHRVSPPQTVHTHEMQQQHPHFVCQTCHSVVCLPASQAINEAWANYSKQIQSLGSIKEVLLKGLCLTCDR